MLMSSRKTQLVKILVLPGVIHNFKAINVFMTISKINLSST